MNSLPDREKSDGQIDGEREFTYTCTDCGTEYCEYIDEPSSDQKFRCCLCHNYVVASMEVLPPTTNLCGYCDEQLN